MARFAIQELDREDDQHLVMAREVRAGLAARPRSLPSKYFYDDAGSRLFDAICELPEYYLTRAEYTLLERHAGELVAGCETLLEIGSGMARKTGLLVAALCARATQPTYVPFDISRASIDHATDELLRAHERLHVRGVIGDFTRDLAAIVRPVVPRAPRLFAFLGSTVGNLDEVAAPAFMRSVARLMTEHDHFLLGVDLVKDERILHAAYNDSAGVTAAFNRNIMHVIARELDGDPIDDDAFEHLAFYDSDRARIEMHLVATRPLVITLRAIASRDSLPASSGAEGRRGSIASRDSLPASSGAEGRRGSIDLRVELANGERVLTEISRKFTRASVEATLAAGGLQLERWITDEQFGLALARRT